MHKNEISVSPWQENAFVTKEFPVDTGRKLNVHKTFRRRPGRLLNVLCTFNLRPVSTGFQNWKIELYSEKDKPGAFENRHHSQSHKTAVLRKITRPSKEYGKVSEMHNKNIGTEQNGNQPSSAFSNIREHLILR